MQNPLTIIKKPTLSGLGVSCKNINNKILKSINIGSLNHQFALMKKRMLIII
ncbi:hypothetical protein C427_1845 [Paraglaciecola psychrophila 170]|uniref:Uncharacterized protein n=1 Tax=Paraglaciecola psychrophila 170 TaxID=1129794 RepID=K7A9F4_9ALTE|nr:hypothetical protein C427_1845 [Paraglaciecola psychrophila 170]GAC37353.1 hypothetical protein GPSY_1724 [Paraglaciecola psychrophila 170]